MDLAVLRRNRRIDFLAKQGITFGGALILVCVVGMLAMLLMETLPLFFTPEKKILTQFDLPRKASDPQALALGVDEYLETGYWIDRDGRMTFLDLVRGIKTDHVDFSKGPKLLQAAPYGANRFTLLFEDGSVALVRVRFQTEFAEDNQRTVEHQASVVRRLPVGTFAQAPVKVQLRAIGAGLLAVAQLPDNRLQLVALKVDEDFLGNVSESRQESFINAEDPVSAYSLNEAGTQLYVATVTGKLMLWSLTDPEEPSLSDLQQAFNDGRQLTDLALLFGDESIVVGDSKGQVTTWFMAPVAEGSPEKRLTRIHDLSQFDSPVQTLASSLRNKSVLALADGKIILDHSTSERELLTFETSAPITHFAFSTRGNGLLAMDGQDKVTLWSVDAPHPEGSWLVYFGKVWYESYDAPDYVWQSSAGTDDFEPKFSLIPLIFGSLKGTLYAMLFAVPIAIFGALYTNQFASRRFQAIVKPAVEITAAVPSVIIGFLAALWLAPIVDQWLLSFFLFILILPTLLSLFLLAWARLRTNLKIRLIEQSKELYLAMPLLLAAIGLSVWLQPLVQDWLFDGNFKQWIFDNITKNYDQRNSIVISFALGFIVIPFIFTMTDDALSSVPDSLKAASAALGASRWQTTWKVLLPSASPGLFAGTILGMGRAIGETMIVLMATGNTPIIDLSMFNGMRTLSANIAVEIPEAPVGGSLYRVLFLSAVILFSFTFVINSLAELFRYTLRKKYAEF